MSNDHGVPPIPIAAKPANLKQRSLYAAKLAVSLSLLIYLFSLVDFGSVKQSFANLQPHYIGIAVVLLLCQSVFSTFKWRTLLQADGIVLRFLYLLKTYLISNFVSLFLPTSFGGDIYRVMAVRKVARSTAKTTSSVLFDRLTGLFALLSIAAIAYVTNSQFPYKWLVAIGFVFGLIVFWLGTSGVLIGHFSAVKNKWLRKLIGIFESFHTYARNRRCLVVALVVSFAFQLNVVLINKMYSLAFGLEIPFATLLVIIPLVYLTEAIPFSINGLGFREGAFVFFYQLAGQSVEAGLAVSLLVLTLRYSMGLVGGSLLVFTLLKGSQDGRENNSTTDHARSTNDIEKD